MNRSTRDCSYRSEHSIGCQELDQQPIHLAGTLLLGPVADAGTHRFLPEIGQVGFERLEFVVEHLNYGVLVAGDKKRWLPGLRAVEKRRQGPVPVHVAVVI